MKIRREKILCWQCESVALTDSGTAGIRTLNLPTHVFWLQLFTTLWFGNHLVGSHLVATDIRVTMS